ncbi:MAG: hypothetical protein ACRDOP_08440, partial [Gaiellaceae bacterium]
SEEVFTEPAPEAEPPEAGEEPSEEWGEQPVVQAGPTETEGAAAQEEPAAEDEAAAAEDEAAPEGVASAEPDDDAHR